MQPPPTCLAFDATKRINSCLNPLRILPRVPDTPVRRSSFQQLLRDCDANAIYAGRERGEHPSVTILTESYIHFTFTNPKTRLTA
jgi:hypothetical protein